MPWSADDVQEELAKMDPDILYLLEDNGVTQEIQAKLAYAGFSSVSKLRGLGDSREDIRDILRDSMGIDAQTNLTRRALVAAVQAAWEAAKTYVDKKSQAEAEDRIRGEPRSLKLTEFLRVKAAMEKVQGKTPEELVPAPCVIERMISDIEEGEWLPLQLDEVASKREADQDMVIGSQLSRDGLLRITKKPKLKIGMPQNSEDLRARLRLLANALSMIRLKLSNQAWLRTSERSVWEKHIDYILGPKVKGRVVKDELGREVATPPWHLVLSFEYHIREKAAELVNEERLDLQAALIKARKDEETRSDYFTTPLAISVREISQKPLTPKLTLQTASTGGQATGFGKGKKRRRNGKIKQNTGQANASVPGATEADPKTPNFQELKAAGKKKLKTKTPDNKPICFKFNNGDKCDASCGRVHCCQICFALDHGYKACKA